MRGWRGCNHAESLGHAVLENNLVSPQCVARSFGYLFFGVGVILLLLIIYAMVSRLAH
jgi:hypothetical protein